jgi:1-acyl-sn-glycerol-3-phosphate acyltransferase
LSADPPPAERQPSFRFLEAERRAVERWNPASRWYHPLIGKVVINASRFVTRVMNRLDVEGREHLEAMRARTGRGLLTFSNHVSLFDDPLITSNFVQGPYRKVRWVGADALNFFGSPMKAWFFTAGKCAPIVRGGGIDQPAMNLLRDRLLAGDWVHMFPEGGRTRDAEAKLAPEFKPGIGWLIAQAKPLALPFYHSGMQEVLPVASTRPRTGHRVRVVFGAPIDCDERWIDDVCRRRLGDRTDGPRLWDGIAEELRDVLGEMEREIHPAFAV